MERCENSLQKLIESRRYWADKDFLKQIITGLDYLHAMSIIHRDIKPSNVLVTRNVRNMLIPKLADFGISKTANVGGNDETRNCRGSNGWTAPELCNARQENGRPVEYNKSVDIFATGCLFYYIITRGSHPFQGPDAKSKQKLNLSDCDYNIQKYGRGEGSYDLSSLIDDEQNQPHYDLKDLIERMIEKEPEKRMTTKEILSHPYFWDAVKSLTYIRTAVDEKLKSEKLKHKRNRGSSVLINLLENNSDVVTGGNWKNRLTPNIRITVDFGQGRKLKNPIYDGASVYDLLLCIRDKVTG